MNTINLRKYDTKTLRECERLTLSSTYQNLNLKSNLSSAGGWYDDEEKFGLGFLQNSYGKNFNSTFYYSSLLCSLALFLSSFTRVL